MLVNRSFDRRVLQEWYSPVVPPKAAHFDGASQYLQKASSADVAMGTGQAFTIGCNFKLEKLGVFQPLIAKFNGPNSTDGDYYLAITAANNLRAAVSQGATIAIQDSSVTYGAGDIGSWNFAAMMVDPAAKTLRTQTQGVGTTGVFGTTDPQITTAPLMIGAGVFATAQYFQGLIDNVGIWQSNLASGGLIVVWENGDLGMKYSQLAGAGLPAPVAYYNLDDAGALWLDATGRGNTLTNVGGVASRLGLT